MIRALLRALVLVPLLTVPAQAATWGLGSNLGLTVLAADGDRTYVAAAWSGSPMTSMPGLRLSLRDEDGRATLHLDTGFQLVEGDDFGQSATHTTLNGSLAFGDAGLVPFATVGCGIATRAVKALGPGGQRVSTLSGVVGGGLGIQRSVAKGAGQVRLEAHYDYVSQGEDDGIELLPSRNAIGVKLGFDLWLR